MTTHQTSGRHPTVPRATPETSTSPTARQLWTRTRGVVAAVALLVVAGLVIAALQTGDRYGMLDPRSADRNGSRAVAELLDDQGVDVTVVTTTAEATAAVSSDTTLLVARPDLLAPRQLTELRGAYSGRGGRTVLLGPGPDQASTLVPEVRAADEVPVSPRQPDCRAGFASRAGSVALGGYSYAVSADPVDACYPSQGLPTLVRVPDSGGTGDAVIVGSPDLLFNDHLDEHGNASLALQLLGSRPQLVWYLPSLADPSAEGSGDKSLLELLPPGWFWGSIQLTIAVVLAAAWRARRLGPLVSEGLPVTVHASETTEGRARLYRQTNARAQAADVLRMASRRRLASLVGVSTTVANSPEVLVKAVAAHSTSPGHRTWSEADVSSLLFGPAPSDDRELVVLSNQLDEVELMVTALHTDKERPS